MKVVLSTPVSAYSALIAVEHFLRKIVAEHATLQACVQAKHYFAVLTLSSKLLFIRAAQAPQACHGKTIDHVSPGGVKILLHVLIVAKATRKEVQALSALKSTVTFVVLTT